MFTETRSSAVTGWMKATGYVRAGGGWAKEVLCYDSRDKVTLVHLWTHELLWKSDSIFIISTVTDSSLRFGKAERYLQSSSSVERGHMKVTRRFEYE